MKILKNKTILIVGILGLFGLLSSCSGHKLKQSFRDYQKDESYFKGFVLFDPVLNKELVNHQGAKYFTPASNTKLFTFYATYTTFKDNDSVKSLAYFMKGDSLIIRGTADPSFLYDFNDSNVLSFLKKAPDTIYLMDVKIDEPVYGAGWSWDDYQEYYMPEKNLFPMYGNVLTIKSTENQVESYPEYFKRFISSIDSLKKTREFFENKFFIKKDHVDEYTIPFLTSNQIVADLLGEYLNKEIILIPREKAEFKYVNGLHYDELLKQMMVISDNFIAEQLMLQVGYETMGIYSVKKAINYTLEHYLPNLPEPPRWVDGSGLSRYNLFTPNDMVYLLHRMYQEIPLTKLFSYFPVGGESGTLKNWYSVEGKPFVYAKSGTLSNNYNLSGFLKTKKGRVLIFSYMNNHYSKSTSSVKKEMEQTLKSIYNTY